MDEERDGARDVGGIKGRETDCGERKELESKKNSSEGKKEKHKKRVNQSSIKLIEREEGLRGAKAGREVETRGREARFIGEQVIEGKRQKQGMKCAQGNHGAKARGIDG